MVHRFILAARSVVFRGMMEVDMKEKMTGVVEIKDADPEVVTEFTNFMYSDQISDEFTDLSELLMNGHKYQVSSLVEECSKRLVKEVSFDNVVQLGTLAENYNVSVLSQECSEFISRNLVSLDRKELNLAPPALLTKSLVALNNMFSEEESPVHAETKTLYMANFARNPSEPVIVKENDSIITEFRVNQEVTLAGIGVYLSGHDIPIELSLFFDYSNFMMTLTTTIVSCDWSKPVKIMFPSPVSIGNYCSYKLEMKMRKSCVRLRTEEPHSFHTSLSISMGDMVVQVAHEDCMLVQIPVLYFED